MVPKWLAPYKHLTNDWEDRFAINHLSVEGQLKFKAITFITKQFVVFLSFPFLSTVNNSLLTMHFSISSNQEEAQQY